MEDHRGAEGGEGGGVVGRQRTRQEGRKVTWVTSKAGRRLTESARFLRNLAAVSSLISV